jgi:hypothetical protein
MRELISLTRKSDRYNDIFKISRESRSRVTSVYDISSICNLFCEGCLFFNRDGGYEGNISKADTAHYHRLFTAEKLRGVNYPLFAGAEPSLKQDVLKIAAQYWTNGMVHTNGIKPIDPSLPFRLYVSIWGGPELTRKWRGADCYKKTLRSAAADSRAIMNYTVNSQNIDDILSVVQDCSKLNLTITFQVYSPTADYRDYLEGGQRTDHSYIQGEGIDDNLILSTADDAHAEAVICKAIDLYPDVVVFTKPLAHWLFARPGLFPDAPTDGQAPKNCFAANDLRHQHVLLGGKRETQKSCGHASIICKTCRAYTSIYTEYFREKLAGNMLEKDAIDYLDVHEVFDTLYEGHRRPHCSKRKISPKSVLKESAF